MKRLLLVLALAVALLGLLAAPALAYQAPLSVAENTAYVVIGGQLFNGHVWWDFNPPEYGTPHDSLTEPIPYGYDVLLYTGVVAPNRGSVVSWPSIAFFNTTLTGDNGYGLSLGTAASKQLWSTVWNAGVYAAFNKEFATYWQRDWYVDLRALDVGSYSGSTHEKVIHPVADLSFGGDTWSKHAQQRPGMYPAGERDFPLTFTVKVMPD